MQDILLVHKGKVRDVYEIGCDLLLIRHTDRVSSFDKVWCDIENKGKILYSTSVWWFDRTKHIIPNHLVYAFPNHKDMIVKKCLPFKIEFVVRGYIAGNTNTSLWTKYSQGERVYCGLKFPDGLKQNQRLQKPIVTPTTKGDTDRPISPDEIVETLIMSKDDYDFCAQKAMELYKYGSKIAKGCGLILVDTKYEFGIDSSGNILLIDEIHTCDSSRYWKADTYDARFQSGMEPEKFDKDLIRTYVKSQCDPYSTKPSDVTIPDSIKQTVQRAYSDFYTILTGNDLPVSNEVNDVKKVAQQYFEQYHVDRIYVIEHRENANIHMDGDDILEHINSMGVYCQLINVNIFSQTDQLLQLLKDQDAQKQRFNHNVIYIVCGDTTGTLSNITAYNTSSIVITKKYNDNGIEHNSPTILVNNNKRLYTILSRLLDS